MPQPLTDAERQDVLAQRILPAWTARAVRQDRPVRVYVAGQPGSGKTTFADLVQGALDGRGRAVRIGSDLYKAEHRDYAELLAADVRSAGTGVRADTRRWQAQVEAHVRAHRLDAVIETALADVEEVRANTAADRSSGARIELVVVAAPWALSQFGLLARFLAGAVDGPGGRYVSWENHDTCAERLLECLAVIEDEGLADRVAVVRRDGAVLYDNELTATGSWRRAPAARQAVSAEWERPWTARETSQFLQDLALTERRLHTAPMPEDSRLAVQRDVARAAALAEPVRRTAQAIRTAPGVDYHRLSPAEHLWTFDELIVPSYLRDITTQQEPVAVYVMGPPGAGTAQAARLAGRALREHGRRPVRIAPGRFHAMHPDYLRLLQDEPRTATTRIRADCMAWQERAEAYVRAQRGDMVIEIAPDDAAEFSAGVARSRRAGYRVELVVLAVRAADSRQGAASVYAQVTRGGMPASYQSVAGHDRCFAAVTACLAAAEHGGDVAAVTVLDRGGDVLHRNTRTSNGQWADEPGAVQVLAGERQRPYTEQEADAFHVRQEQLRRALPQYRAELVETAQLARLLMPGPGRHHGHGGRTPLAVLPPPGGRRAYEPVSSLYCAS
ncbi:zeta toxin family protein [Streptomyces sp. NPDC054863]